MSAQATARRVQAASNDIIDLRDIIPTRRRDAESKSMGSRQPLSSLGGWLYRHLQAGGVQLVVQLTKRGQSDDHELGLDVDEPMGYRAMRYGGLGYEADRIEP